MGFKIDGGSQRQRLLKYLKEHPQGITTRKAIMELDILSPSTRCCELKSDGHNIVSHWDIIETAHAKHRNVRYVLLPN